MKIKRKMAVAFITSALILLGFLLIVMKKQTDESVYPLNLSIAKQVLSERCEQINNWFEGRMIELQDLAEFAPTYQLSEDNLKKELEKLRLKDPKNYHTLRLITKDGISKGKNGIDFPVTNREYYQELEKNPGLTYSVSNLVQSKEDKQPIVLICYRLKDSGVGQFKYIAAAVSLNQVLALAQDLPLYDGKGILLDQKKFKFTSGKKGRFV